MPNPALRWWWCAPCDVKWYGEDDICWACDQPATTTSKPSSPSITSQWGLRVTPPSVPTSWEAS